LNPQGLSQHQGEFDLNNSGESFLFRQIKMRDPATFYSYCLIHNTTLYMYSARDRVENESWLEEIRTAAVTLNLSSETQTVAEDLFLSQAPDSDRSKRAIAAASLYAGTLITGSERSQSAVADAMNVTRLSVQQHWKGILNTAGFQPPSW
jgi:transcription initiation factor TFIIIB Brf1 subunit/transcription initiation factor TFIIB